jgi:acyl dehydratase
MSFDQHALITDEAIAKVRELTGVWLRRDTHWPAIYEPISMHDIRRWAMFSMGDDNPLFTSTDYAKSTIWGTTIAPPTFLYSIDTTIVGPGLPGVQWLYGGTEWDFYHPVRVGDTITSRARMTDVREREGRHVPKMVIQTGETQYFNQNGQMVARAIANMMRIPRSRSKQGLREIENAPRERPVYSEEDIEGIRQEYLAEERRGAEIRYFEDVEVGDDIGTVTKGPLTLVDIVGFYAGRRYVYNVHGLAYKERERHPANVYVSQNTGVPVHPAAGHFDAEIAGEVGMPRAYDQGFMRPNWYSHLLTNWAGDAGIVRRLKTRLSRPHFVGDLARCHGTVTGKRIVGDQHLVDIVLTMPNQDGIEVCPGEATVELLSRSVS